MNINDLEDWLRYLNSLPSGLNSKSLDHLKSLAEKLSVLSFSSRVITVTGTNGKGSTVILLESILLASGFSVCAYISPHLLHYHERIRLNGIVVDNRTLCWAFALVENVRSAANIVLSYFEFSTLAALVIFKKQQPDFMLLEVGLGGRCDPVNILDSDIAVITTISLDHTHVLGNTKDAIGKEKFGIMRSFKPVICGVNMPDSVYSVANNTKSVLYCLNRDFFYSEKEDCWDWCFGKDSLVNLPLPKLPVANAALVLMVIKLLSTDFKILPSAVITGLRNAFLPGRFQKIVFSGKEIILDVAHNFEATTLFAAKLTREKSSGRILAVASMLKDKDIVGMLKPLVSVIDEWYVSILSSPRAAKKQQLLECLDLANIRKFSFSPTVAISLQQAIAECKEKDKIAVFGSFLIVAEILIINYCWR